MIQKQTTLYLSSATEIPQQGRTQLSTCVVSSQLQLHVRVFGLWIMIASQNLSFRFSLVTEMKAR